jgi:predicted nucleic acid-binding protein
LPFDPGDTLARHDPAAWTRTLAYRDRAELPFDAGAVDVAAPVMLDTTVYLDALRAPGLPAPVARLVARNVVLHCAIACAELAVSVGHLDPAHPSTAAYRAPLVETLSRMAPARIVAPSAGAWTEAAVIGGILARIQGYPRDSRRALLNDALMLLTALEAGATLISRNVRHMDLLLRFRPDALVLLYDRPGVAQRPAG